MLHFVFESATCNDRKCEKQQGGVVGHGLLPWITSCHDKENCVDTIRDELANMITGKAPITKENLIKVSADGIVISPEVIASIQRMDSTQQSIVINKLSQEIAVQRLIDKALIARNILATGSQVPVISSNHPAQIVISRAITNLDNDIRSITFESQIRKQTMSDTLSKVLSYADDQQKNAMQIAPISASTPIMENGAVGKEKK